MFNLRIGYEPLAERRRSERTGAVHAGGENGAGARLLPPGQIRPPQAYVTAASAARIVSACYGHTDQ